VSGLRLEWTANGFGEWTATAGALRVRVDEDGWWSVDGLKRSTPDTQSTTLVDAQFAAESACRSLLIEALVPFASEPLPHGYTVREIDESEAGEEAPLVMLSDECTDEVFTCEDAEAIGVALIAAAHASRHHGKAGGG
jgi:hypothetical protein